MKVLPSIGIVSLFCIWVDFSMVTTYLYPTLFW
jgi:hypothetical protein